MRLNIFDSFWNKDLWTKFFNKDLSKEWGALFFISVYFNKIKKYKTKCILEKILYGDLNFL